MPINHHLMPVPSFDPCDEDSWFFGFMSRADAAELLKNKNEIGAFLVRESTTAKGDLVLSVKERETEPPVSHYIIQKRISDKNQQLHFLIGDQDFPDIPTLLDYYRVTNLDETNLKAPAKPKDPTIHTRSFTKDYLAEVQEGLKKSQTCGHKVGPAAIPRKIPCEAVAIQSRIPNAYDKTALTFQVGETLLVTEANIDGCWEGEVIGSHRKGHFPFNYVRFIDPS